MKFSAAQLEAITRSGQDVCVSAGPGSGKTRVLVERFAWLVEQGVSPLRILAITFTDKAANEIKQRLVKRFEKDAGLRSGMERAWVSTIHGFCARLLRENALAAGLDPAYMIQEEAAGALDPIETAERALDELFAEQPSAFGRLLEALPDRDLARTLVRVYDAIRTAAAGWSEVEYRGGLAAASALEKLRAQARTVVESSTAGWNASQQEYAARQREWARSLLDQGQPPRWRELLSLIDEFDCDLTRLKKGSPVRDALSRIKKELLAPARSAVIGALFRNEGQLLQQALARFDALYREQKRAAAVLDFADLEEHAIRLLEGNPAVRARLQRSFDAILMDELQDTDPLQWRLVDLLRREGRFFAVGDINQSIYGFRHAEPEVFRRYRRSIEQRNLAVDVLAENYRSRGGILWAAGRVLEGAAGIEPMPLTACGAFAEKSDPSVEIIAVSAETSTAGSELEARWVARRIRELEGALLIGPPEAPRTARFSDMAVLVRTTACIEPLAAAFVEFGIPYLQSKGRTFFASREVLDLINWLRVLANPLDEISLAAVLRSPLVGASDEALARLKTKGHLWKSLCALAAPASGYDPAELERLLDTCALIQQLRKQSDYVSPDWLAARILDESGYLEGIEARARANIEKFLAMVRDLHATSRGPLSQILEKLDAWRSQQPEPDAPPAEAADAVNVLTIHGAKGLEFPVVFLAAMHKGTANQAPPVIYHPATGLGARWQDPYTGETVADDAHQAAQQLDNQRDEQERDRLLYVAMTRAAEHLVMSFAVSNRSTSPWPKLVLAKLGVSTDKFDNTPELVNGMRVLRASSAPPPWEASRRSAGAAAPLHLDRPALTGQHDSTVTVTAVALFQACPRRYFLQRYLGWPPASGSGLRLLEVESDAPADAGELGRQVHALLAGLGGGPVDPEAIELADRFRTSELGRRASRASRIEREFDFLMELDGVLLRGQIDLWFEEGGELVLVDYKTGSGEDDIAAYALQLRLYALALERICGRLPDRAVLCYLRSGSMVEVNLNARALNDARQKLAALGRAQDSLDFPLRQGPHCLRCGYYGGACPAGHR